MFKEKLYDLVRGKAPLSTPAESEFDDELTSGSYPE